LELSELLFLDHVNSLNTYAELAMISLSCINLDVSLTAIYEDVLSFG